MKSKQLQIYVSVIFLNTLTVCVADHTIESQLLVFYLYDFTIKKTPGLTFCIKSKDKFYFLKASASTSGPELLQPGATYRVTGKVVADTIEATTIKYIAPPTTKYQKAEVFLLSFLANETSTVREILDSELTLADIEANIILPDKKTLIHIIAEGKYVSRRNIEIAEILLKRSANVKAKDKYGLTALDYAIADSVSDLEQLFRKYGAIK
jgi:hypothetical protein